jgi:hypothetical protein
MSLSILFNNYFYRIAVTAGIKFDKIYTLRQFVFERFVCQRLQCAVYNDFSGYVK